MYFYILMNLMIGGWRSFKMMMELVIQVQFYVGILVGSCSRSTLSPIIMVQWKITQKIKGNDPIGDFHHFPLNHDYGTMGGKVNIKKHMNFYYFPPHKFRLRKHHGN